MNQEQRQQFDADENNARAAEYIAKNPPKPAPCPTCRCSDNNPNNHRSGCYLCAHVWAKRQMLAAGVIQQPAGAGADPQCCPVCWGRGQAIPKRNPCPVCEARKQLNQQKA